MRPTNTPILVPSYFVGEIGRRRRFDAVPKRPDEGSKRCRYYRCYEQWPACPCEPSTYSVVQGKGIVWERRPERRRWFGVSER